MLNFIAYTRRANLMLLCFVVLVACAVLSGCAKGPDFHGNTVVIQTEYGRALVWEPPVEARGGELFVEESDGRTQVVIVLPDSPLE